MAGFTIERKDFVKVEDLMSAVIADMLANGFTRVYPAEGAQLGKDVILQPDLTIDPLMESQPWQVRFMWDRDPSTAGTAGAGNITETTTGGKCDVLVATPLQFAGNKCASYVVKYEDGNPMSSAQTDYVGLIGTMARTGSSLNQQCQFLDRSGLQAAQWAVYPMSYRLTITNRGFALFVWEQPTDSTGNRNSWIVVQRPVDNITGETIVTGKCPVHCLYGLMGRRANEPYSDVNGAFNIRRFVVREIDVAAPYPLRMEPVVITPTPTEQKKELLPGLHTPMMGADAVRNNVDYAAVMSGVQQVCITEGNKYIVTFPNGFNTARHGYTHEMDLIAYTSADVVSQSTEIDLTVYGENENRKYVAMSSNGPNNTGMRLLMLAQGGGVDAPVTPPAGP